MDDIKTVHVSCPECMASSMVLETNKSFFGRKNNYKCVKCNFKSNVDDFKKKWLGN